MKVFELHRAIYVSRTWHPTGGTVGKLYATLERAQGEVDGGAWRKDPKQRVWRNEHGDIVSERTVIQ